MNELDELAGLRADVTGRSPEDLVKAREALLAGMRGGTGRRGRWRLAPAVSMRSRTRIGLALTGAAAVVTAAAVAAGVVLAGPGHTSPAGRGGGRPVVHPPAVLTAAYVLGRAARAAARTHQPVPRPGQYIYVRSVETVMTGGGVTACPEPGQGGTTKKQAERCRPQQLGGSWLEADGRQIWQSVSGYRTGALREVQLGNSGTPWGGKPPAVTGPRVSWYPLPPPPCHRKPTIGSYDYLTTLPTSPSALRAWLYTNPDGGQGQPDDLAWTEIGDLLREMLVPPKLAAALFRVAATIPGARLVPHAADAVAQRGIAVGRYDRKTKAYAELIFDPRTYQYIGDRDVLAKPVKGVGPAGTLVESTAQLQVSVVSQLPKYTATAPAGRFVGGC